MSENPWPCCNSLENAVFEQAILFVGKFREWGIPIPDGGASFMEMTFCPFCGARLLPSVRGAWFDKAEALGIGPPYDQMPAEYLSEAWWLVSN